MINPLDLEYFLEVAHAQHLSRAAERLGLTQPALSRCVQRLEEEVKTPLLLRSKKGVTLTAAGKRLQQYAQELLQKWENVRQVVQNELTEVSGVLRMGAHPAVAQYTLPRFLPRVLQKYPGLTLQLHHGLSRHMTEDVVSDRLDLAIVVNPISHPDLVIQELCRDNVKLWRKRGSKNEDVLLFDPSLRQSQEILLKLQKQGWDFQRKIESSSLEVLTQLLVAGAGYAILPKRVVETATASEVEAIPSAPTLQDRICLVFKPELRRSKKGQVVIEEIQKAIRA